MKTSIPFLGTIAAAGTQAIVLNVPTMQHDLQFKLVVKYAAVAGTSGVTVAMSEANDGGTTYTSIRDGALTVAPAAGVTGYGNAYVAMQGDPNMDLGEHPTNFKLLLTNLDATNAATVALAFEFEVEAVG